MPRGIPATGKRAPGGGRKTSPEPSGKKQLNLFVTPAEATALRDYLKTLRQGEKKPSPPPPQP